MSKIYCEELGKEFDTKVIAETFESLEYEGKDLYQIQDSYADGTIEAPVWNARAIDNEGNLYMVTWTQYDTDAENECYVNEEGKQMGDWSDGANACNWDEYTVKSL